MDQRPKCKSQNYTTLERKHKSKFLWPRIRQRFIDWWMDKQNTVHSYNGILFNSKHLDTCYNMDELWHYVSETAGHKGLYIIWFCLYEMSSKRKLIETESKSMVAKGCR